MRHTKTIMPLILVSSLGLSAFAAKKTDRDVERLNRKMNLISSSMKGVVGQGAQTCDSLIGELSDTNSPSHDQENTEPCSVLYVEDQETEAALKTVFPLGTRIDGVLITISIIGKIGLI